MERNLIIKKINENWDKIKAEIVEYWKDFTAEQIEVLRDYDSLANQLRIVYKFSDVEIDIEIGKFIDKLGLTPVEVHLEELRRALYQSTRDATMKISKTLEQSVDQIKDTSGQFQQFLTQYVKKYPLKSICISFVCGVFVNKILTKK